MKVPGDVGKRKVNTLREERHRSVRRGGRRPRSAPSSANPLNPFLFPPSHFLFAGARLAAATSSFIIRQSPAKTRETRASLLIPQNQCRLKLLYYLPHRYISLPSTYTSPYLAYCLTKDSALRNARHCFPFVFRATISRSVKRLRRASSHTASPRIPRIQTHAIAPFAFRTTIALSVEHLQCSHSCRRTARKQGKKQKLKSAKDFPFHTLRHLRYNEKQIGR